MFKKKCFNTVFRIYPNSKIVQLTTHSLKAIQTIFMLQNQFCIEIKIPFH